MAKKQSSKSKKNTNKTAKKSTKSKKSNKSSGKKQKDIFAGLKKDELKKALRHMMVSRAIDEKAMNLLRQGKSFFHIAGAGHEAIQTAVGFALDSQKDWFFPYYRDLAISLAAGVKPKEFFLQCFAKADDPSSGGKQLPCHWGHPDFNLPSQSSPTGTQFLNAVGTALASVREGKKSISYVSSGEGTTSQGEFHEAVNWASRSKLPVLFVIENNKYAISVPVNEQSGGKEHSISEMMAGYNNLLRMKIDGTEYIECYEKVKEAVKYLHDGKGPVLIEAEVVRLHSHSSSDDQKKYRTKEELEADIRKDPINQLSDKMRSEGLLNEDEFKNLQDEVKEEVGKASDEAFKADDCDPRDADKYIYDESELKDSLEYEKNDPDGDKIVMVDAINHALHEEMENNDKMYIFGEDIADNKGGVFTATKGLSNKFGMDRVFNSPLAEASIMGVSVGMALTGLKPVVEIQFGDYIWPGFMQFKSEVATMRYRSNNTWTSPVVTRVAVGGHIHGGLYHSQNIESIFAHVPGIYIAFPSNAADAKGLLKTACRINDPVLFLEHKGLYRKSSAMSPEPDKEYLISFGKARIAREGKDITVVTYGLQVWESIEASKQLDEEEGYSVEVIDIRTISPLDTETIFESVKKTNKVIVIHEDTLTGGFGAEIASRVADECFQFLDGPVKRIAAKDSHIPYAPILEDAILPNKKKIYNGIKELLEF